MEYIKSINRCRLYIKVITFVDISNVEGTFMKKIVDCRDQINSLLRWPFQQRPGCSERKVWIKFLQRFCVGENRLWEPLCDWLTAPKYRRWDYECSGDRNTLYTLKKGKRREHSRIKTKNFKSKGMVCDEKVIAKPVFAIWSSIGIIVPNFRVVQNTQQVQSFKESLQKAHQYIRDTIGWVTSDGDLEKD